MIKQEELPWKKVRDQISTLNPVLTEIIDDLDPNSKKYTLFDMSYFFGDEILKRAELNLPTIDGGLIPLKSNEVDSHTKECLGYNYGCNPVGLLLNNAVELFITLEDHVIPYAIIPSGKVFGAWRILDTAVSHCPPTFLWGMTAGARSIYMLQKISESLSHTQLSKKYDLKSEKPKSLRDHWGIFKELSNHENFGKKWETRLLFFTGKWFEKLHDKAWERFKLYLIDMAWQSSSYWRNQFIWGFVFSLIQKNKNIKSSNYIDAIVRHILSIAVGALPGFRPALDNSLAPIDQLQKIYEYEYNLKGYAPIIMQPAMFSIFNDCPPVYYSMHYPTSIEFSLKPSERTSTLTDQYHVLLLLRNYLMAIEEGELNIKGTPLESVGQEVKFNFYHTNTAGHKEIHIAKEILKTDTTFATLCKGKIFPKNSPFFNGCIQIAHAK